MMWGYGGMGMIFMALFWFGVVALVVWGIRSTGDARVRQDSSTRAIEILEQRYARGDIDSSEFQERRAELER
ncbi:MAG: SHOCT domain-containing protein [Actinomycetia bacterium]|nr:SHOCT domain-containing protein [Actinomycetes bacterium]